MSHLAKFPRTVSKLYEGMVNSSGFINRPATTLPPVLRTAIFGDSVANGLPQFILPQLQKAWGAYLPLGAFSGGFFNAVTPSGGASMHEDGTSGEHWINGLWGILPSGALEFKQSGGRAAATLLIVPYSMGPDEGSFKLQTDGGSGFADEAGYTNVDCYSATRTAGVIVLTKPANTRWAIRFVHLSGTVHPLVPAFIDETKGGIANFGFSRGGLTLATAMQTPPDAIRAVMSALGIELAFMEFKDPDTFPYDFATFMGIFKEASPDTEWSFTGTSPQLPADQDATNIINNGVQRAYADANGHFYFDRRTHALDDFFRFGWLIEAGDAIHPRFPCDGLHASMWWSAAGFENLLAIPSGHDVSGQVTIPFGGNITILGNQGVVGQIGTETSGSDLVFRARRAATFYGLTGTFMRGAINTDGNFASSFGPTLGLSWPFSTSGPALVGEEVSAGVYRIRSFRLTTGNPLIEHLSA